MKVRFNTVCIDKNTGRQYGIGEVVEFDDKRGTEIISSSFASAVDEAPKTVPAKKATKKKEG